MNGNGFNNFRGMTPQMMNAMMARSGNNFNNAYRNGQTMIGRHDFTNNGDVVHNNLGDSLLTEQIETYSVLIDGDHKDHSVHKNPFKFPVIFGGSGTTEKTYMDEEFDDSHANPKKHKWIKVKRTRTFRGSTGVRVGRELDNVKFIRLIGVSIPTYTKIEFDAATGGGDDTFKYVTSDSDYDMSEKIYTTLRLKGLSDFNRFTSGNFTGDDSFTLRIDKSMGSKHNLWVPIDRNIISYKNSSLSTIGKFNVVMYDHEDVELPKPILTYNDENNGSTPTERDFDYSTILSELEDIKDDISDGGDSVDPFTGGDTVTEVNETIEKLTKIRKATQIKIFMDLGVAENELNTDTKYEK